MASSDCQLNAFCYLFGLFYFMFLLQTGNSTQFTVGGSKGWTFPNNSTSSNYNQWAGNTRFRIGDSLLFVYKAGQDSVIEVNKQDYDNCSTTAPISPPLSDGHSMFTFNRSGSHYFISGNKENCLKNVKLVVIVLAERNNHSSNVKATVSASPPANATVSASPPANATVSNTLPSPSPAPATEEAPPAGTVEINPTPPPAKPHSGASSIFISFTGFIGPFFASSLLF